MQIEWSQFYRSGRYRSSWDYAHPAPELAEWLSTKPIPAGAAVLDAGSGSGRDAVFLARLGFRVHGLDLCAEALALATALAAAHGVAVTWHRGDVLAQPFPAASFRAVTDRGCFHHVADDARPTYAREMARVLEPGGVLFVRGCAGERAPFNPITEAALDAAFDTALFTRESFARFALVVNSGTIDGAAAVLRRR